MRIEWTDVVLMYIMAFLVSPALAAVGPGLKDSILFYALEAPAYAIPLGYYFTKNQCDAKQTTAVALLVGITLTPFLLIPAAVFHFQLTDFITFIDAGEFTFPLKIAMNAVFTVFASLFMWWLIGQLKARLWPKQKASPKKMKAR
ncbi:TPA: hypothetical protein EYP38_03910, partial [Candidatus Micrarchaeota archaeon]|nr:hypothetical protein [Candidatus Micrarchaeota archaeon]